MSGADRSAGLAALSGLRRPSQQGDGSDAGHRCRDRDAIRGALAEFGITRVGDLTGLDSIGLPVWSACRPGSRALAVSLGKGLDETQAWISAVLESVESAMAERHEALVGQRGSIAQIAARGLRSVDLSAIARCSAFLLDPARERHWVEGLAWQDGASVFAPYELIGMDMRSGTPWDHGCFRISSVGLGAGLTYADATLHALLEVIEADGTVLADSPLAFAQTGQRIGFPRQVEHRLNGIAARVEAAGFALEFRRLASDIGLPVVQAILGETERCAASTWSAPASGTACRLCVWEAATDALLEAIQIRAAYISGAREDLVYTGDHGTQRPGSGAGEEAAIMAPPATSVPADVLARLRFAIAALDAAGIRVLNLFPLGMSADGICVVRVLVEGLETADVPQGKGLGHRAAARVLAVAGAA